MASHELQEALRSLCNNTEWCYAIFWKLKHQMLEWEEGFCTPSKTMFHPPASSQTLPSYDRIELAVDKMSYDTHPVGDGIIGQVAFTNMHRWIFSSRDKEYPTEWHEQFAAGIKTIAVIAVHKGVVQLGSKDVTTEDLNLVGHVKSLLFKALQGLKRTETCMFESAMEGTLEEVSHTILEDATTKNMPDISHVWSTLVARGRHLKDEPCSPLQPGSQIGLTLQEYTPFLSPPTHEQQSANLLSSLHSCIGLQQQGFLTSLSLLHNHDLASPSSQNSTANGIALANMATERVESFFVTQDIDCSIFDVKSPTDMAACQQSIDRGIVHKRPRNSFQAKINGAHIKAGACDVGSNSQQSMGMRYNAITSQAPIQGMLVPNIANSLNHSSTSESNTVILEERTLNRCSTSSSCTSHHGFLDVHTFDLSNSCDIEQLAYMGHTHTSQGQNSSSSETKPSSDDALRRAFSNELEEFDNFMASLPEGQDLQSREMTYVPLNPISLEEDTAETLNISSGAPSFWDNECSEHILRSTHVATEKLKEDLSTSCQTFETDIVQIGRYRETGEINNLHVLRLGGTSSTINSLLGTSEHKTSHQEFQKLQAGLSTWAQGGQLPSRAGKKRTRPGEKPKPRPKDRQLIQDRLHELRSIIPSSGKCSIDALLEKTIKYMSFLQTVTEGAGIWNDNCKEQVGEEGQSEKKGGASWVVELGGHGRDCPLFVEDLREPQHMLVEMLCEEEGRFLEIANTLRGLGLKILKGLMESKDEKMWARLVVKGNEHVHRVHVMWSLMQLLEMNARAASTVTA